MAYTPQRPGGWTDYPGTDPTPSDSWRPVAADLNGIEAGIGAAHVLAEAAQASADAIGVAAVQVATGAEPRPVAPFVVWVCPPGVTPANAAATDLIRTGPPGAATRITTTGATFAPLVELAPGSTATVSWVDSDGAPLGSGLTPTIAFGTAATRYVYLVASTPGDVLTLNLGFNSTDDAGRDSLAATYNHASQAVTGVAQLGYLTGLRRFMAASTALTGHLDLTGLTHLEHVECYNADVQQVTLTGCDSLIRLCMERNAVTYYDLNPVRATLRDLRSAEGHHGTALTFADLAGPMAALWHLCVRDQAVVNLPAQADLPVMEQCWVWGTAQTTSDAPISTVYQSFLAYSNGYDQASVDAILAGLEAHAPDGGYVDLTGSAVPSAAGQASATALEARGWTVTVGAAASPRHTIFATGATPAVTLHGDAGGVITLASSGYRLTTATDGWRVVGARLYVPAGGAATLPSTVTLALYSTAHATQLDLATVAPLRTVVAAVVDGWVSADFGTPYAPAVGATERVWVGYTFGDAHYITVDGAPPSTITASDGSPVKFADTAEAGFGRAVYRIGSGGINQSDNTYALDFVWDEG